MPVPVERLSDILSAPVAWDPVAFSVRPPREERKITSHHASSLTGCIREAYYRWINAPITNPTSKISRMKMQAGEDAATWWGHDLSEHAEAWGGKAKILETERVIELKVPELNYPIRGRLDYLVEIEYGQAKQVLAVEYKSLFGGGTDRIIGHHNAVKAATNREWVPGDPMDRPSYLAQIWAYMRSDIVADHWLLVCQDRGSKLYQTYEVRSVPANGDYLLYWARVPKGLPGEYRDQRAGIWKPVPFTWGKIIQRLQAIERAVSQQLPPPRIDPVTGERFMARVSEDGTTILPKPRKTSQKRGETWWKCAEYCKYTNLCWLGKDGGNVEKNDGET